MREGCVMPWSDKNWGASFTLMNQIASDTYDYEKEVYGEGGREGGV